MKLAVLEAGDMAMRYFGKVRVVLKPDHSVVTEADTEVDALLSRLCRDIIPQAAYIGEETARDEAGVRHARESEWAWVVDPIDGTAAFADGIETFCISLGLLRNGQPYAGAVCFPALKHLYEGIAAAPGWPADAGTENSKPQKKKTRRQETSEEESRDPRPESRSPIPDPRTPVSVSSVSSVADENKSKMALYDGAPIHVLEEMPFQDRAILYTDWDAHLHYRITYKGKTRGLGSAAMHYLLVARGVAVGAISAAHVWDYAAAACILRQAGGLIRHLDGRDIDWRDYLDGRNLRPPILGAPPFMWDALAANITYIPSK